MSENTAIQWANHTFNPWWGCVKVSPACKHCYAEAWAKRLGYKWSERRFFGDKHWREPLSWDRKARRVNTKMRVFCASMADVFEDRDDLEEHRLRLWNLIRETPNLIWMLLTKRIENVMWMAPLDVIEMSWIGTTIEDPTQDKRVECLVDIPAKVRFLSCEPLLAPLVFSGENHNYLNGWGMKTAVGPGGEPERSKCQTRGIDWVIAGGESGPKARPMHPGWARGLRDQCVEAGVPYFFKQWGEWLPDDQLPPHTEFAVKPGHPGAPKEWLGKEVCNIDSGLHAFRIGKKAAGRLLDGREWNEVPEVSR